MGRFVTANEVKSVTAHEVINKHIAKTFKRKIYVHKEREKIGWERVLHNHKGTGRYIEFSNSC